MDNQTAMATDQNRHTRQWIIRLGKHSTFTINPWVTLIFILVLSIMLRLGFWQLDRRGIKLTYNQEVATFLAQHKAPLTYANALQAFEDKGRQTSDMAVTVTGTFTKETPIIFHDNRIHQMQAGLHALALFQAEETSLPPVLINLGWLPWPATGRPNLPALTLPNTPITLQGKLFAPNPETWTLEENPPAPNAQGWLLQKLNLSTINKQTSYNIAPFTLRLLPDSQPKVNLLSAHPLASKSNQAQTQHTYPIRAFKATTDWAMTPEKHMGYALQWFVMSLVLTGIYIGVNFKKRSEASAQTE